MTRIFQYIFYRIYCFYKNWGETFPEIAATGRVRGFMIIGYMISTFVFYICSIDLYAGYNDWKWEF